MPHMNNVNFSDIKFALSFQHIFGGKTAFNNRMDHSQ